MSHGWGSCGPSSVGGSDEVRRRLLAEMIGVDAAGMAWMAHRPVFVVWSNGEALKRKIKEEVAEEQRKLDVTVTILALKGFLSPDEARSVRTKLVVVVRDLREDRFTTKALPRISIEGPHLTLSQSY